MNDRELLSQAIETLNQQTETLNQQIKRVEELSEQIKKSEAEKSKEETMNLGNGFIPGTDIPLPQERGTMSDAEYVDYLEDYYAREFFKYRVRSMPAAIEDKQHGIEAPLLIEDKQHGIEAPLLIEDKEHVIEPVVEETQPIIESTTEEVVEENVNKAPTLMPMDPTQDFYFQNELAQYEKEQEQINNGEIKIENPTQEVKLEPVNVFNDAPQNMSIPSMDIDTNARAMATPGIIGKPSGEYLDPSTNEITNAVNNFKMHTPEELAEAMKNYREEQKRKLEEEKQIKLEEEKAEKQRAEDVKKVLGNTADSIDITTPPDQVETGKGVWARAVALPKKSFEKLKEVGDKVRQFFDIKGKLLERRKKKLDEELKKYDKKLLKIVKDAHDFLPEGDKDQHFADSITILGQQNTLVREKLIDYISASKRTDKKEAKIELKAALAGFNTSFDNFDHQVATQYAKKDAKEFGEKLNKGNQFVPPHEMKQHANNMVTSMDPAQDLYYQKELEEENKRQEAKSTAEREKLEKDRLDLKRNYKDQYDTREQFLKDFNKTIEKEMSIKRVLKKVAVIAAPVALAAGIIACKIFGTQTPEVPVQDNNAAVVQDVNDHEHSEDSIDNDYSSDSNNVIPGVENINIDGTEENVIIVDGNNAELVNKQPVEFGQVKDIPVGDPVFKEMNQAVNGEKPLGQRLQNESGINQISVVSVAYRKGDSTIVVDLTQPGADEKQRALIAEGYVAIAISGTDLQSGVDMTNMMNFSQENRGQNITGHFQLDNTMQNEGGMSR